MLQQLGHVQSLTFSRLMRSELPRALQVAELPPQLNPRPATIACVVVGARWSWSKT